MRKVLKAAVGEKADKDEGHKVLAAAIKRLSAQSHWLDKFREGNL